MVMAEPGLLLIAVRLDHWPSHPRARLMTLIRLGPANSKESLKDLRVTLIEQEQEAALIEQA